MGRLRSNYILYDIKDNEQCLMVDTLDKIAEYIGVQERSIRKAMYLHKKNKRRYIVVKEIDE